MRKQPSGFSLIELLVVITVAATIGAAILASYSNSRISARDAKRRGDLVALQQAFEQYFAENGTYAGPSCSTMATPYLQGAFPTDPQGTDYAGVTACTTSSYCVCADLERAGAGNSTNSTCTFGSGDWFCVQNQQ